LKTRRTEFGKTGLLLALGVLALTACTRLAERPLERRIPSAPDTQWRPPRNATTQAAARDTAHSGLEAITPAMRERNWTLDDIVDIALTNNPLTRASWQAARAAAARYGSEKAAWLPRLDADGGYGRARGSTAGGRLAYKSISYDAGVSLSYILFNFGRRIADVEAARQDMIAQNWSHNATVQAVILAVQEAYYQYQYSKAMYKSSQVSLEEARRDLDAAEQKRAAGLGTVADVLQAKTRASQAELSLQSAEGRIKTIRGSLATVMGLPADLDYDIDYLPEDVPADSVALTVDRLIDEALARRPDLAAARAQALQARAEAASTSRERYPEISLTGGAGRIYYNSRDRQGDTYNISLGVSVPLFTGFKAENDVLEARAKAEGAEEKARGVQQQVVLDVWTSYYDLQTAAKRLNTSRDLLASADESHKVALERYRAGVGSVLELLQSQSALEDARAQNIQARTDWFLCLARLAKDTGSLGLGQTSLIPTAGNATNEGK